jgi:hypothetical protein
MNNLRIFNIEKRLERNFTDGKQTTFQFSRKDKHQIDVPEVKKILASFENKAKAENDNIKIMIRALNADKWNTLKAFNTDLDITDFEEYYKDKVHDMEKFEKFNQLQITVFKENK